MSTGFEKRYAELTREECQLEAMLIMIHSVQTGKWDDVPERLMELRKVMAYAPVPETCAPRRRLPEWVEDALLKDSQRNKKARK
jgi:hypothetical protein